MSITSGSYTFGTGGDYATYQAAIADVASLTGNLTLTQISDVTETVQPGNFFNIAFNSFTLRVTSSRTHLGNKADAWIFNVNHGGHGILFNNHLGSKNFTVDNFYIKRIAATTSGTESLVTTENTFINQSCVAIFRDLLLDLNGFGGVAVRANCSDTTGVAEIRIFNNKIWGEGHNDGTLYIVSGWATVENNSIYLTNASKKGIRNISASGIASVFRNNAVFTADACFTFVAGDIAYNNASSDATADDATTQADNLISKTASDEFTSLTSTDATFLTPKSTGTIITGGMTPAIVLNTAGIEGNPRPTLQRNTSIGAHQAAIDYAFRVFDNTDVLNAAVDWLGNGYFVNSYFTGLPFFSGEDGITASTTQTQGQRPLTKRNNIVATVANANDAVTLPADGTEIYIRNNGANTLQIFPALGDFINTGAVNASTTLAAGASVTYRRVNASNWYS